jgi:hypothetical protein
MNRRLQRERTAFCRALEVSLQDLKVMPIRAHRGIAEPSANCVNGKLNAYSSVCLLARRL